MPGYKEKPDVWIEPENSIVFQVRASEFQTSDQYVSQQPADINYTKHTIRYSVGFTLRFPRVMGARADKVD